MHDQKGCKTGQNIQIRFYKHPRLGINVDFKVLLLLFTRPLPRDGGMAEDHGAPKAGQLPRVWTRGRTKTESRQ